MYEKERTIVKEKEKKGDRRNNYKRENTERKRATVQEKGQRGREKLELTEIVTDHLKLT